MAVAWPWRQGDPHETLNAEGVEEGLCAGSLWVLSSKRSCLACSGGAAGHKGKWEMLSTAPWWPWQADGNSSAAPAHILRPQDNPVEGS